ncbi:transcription factor bHLH47 [Cornus florida]|uniref:transcription factor bHLH47 n=1 Tax=Cornus florida TaxID=4283 RepID=UPI00289B171C|nr:transcription factor bHLH47 [Cornus florida]XP_059642379.1 transcription factor bHLH47 [Cornus florida]
MDTEAEAPAVPMVDKVNVVVEKSVSRTNPSKKNQVKVPKRIHKAEREKMKREQLNELFLALANALEPTQQNSGKASILSEATRFLKDMLSQIESLKRENAALLSESQYVTVEKDELQDEKSTLEVQIGKLQRELEERLAQCKPDLNVAPPGYQLPELNSHFPVETASQQAPIVSPIFVIPFRSDPQSYVESDDAQHASKPTSNVSKPHARYPTEADSWPSQLLGKQPN